MKEILVVRVEKDLDQEEVDYIKTTPTEEVEEIIQEHKQNVLEYLLSEGVEEKDIKVLEVYLEK